MVYMKRNGLDVTSFVVMCSCGCGDGFEFKTLDGDVYISALTGEFSNRQGILSSVRNYAEDVLHKITKKQRYLCDCCMEEEDMKDFLFAINHLKFDNEDSDYETFDNDSYLTVWDCDIDNCDSLYGIAICPRIPLVEYIKNKGFRAYELVYSRKTWNRFVEVCNKKFSK